MNESTLISLQPAKDSESDASLSIPSLDVVAPTSSQNEPLALDAVLPPSVGSSADAAFIDDGVPAGLKPVIVSTHDVQLQSSVLTLRVAFPSHIATSCIACIVQGPDGMALQLPDSQASSDSVAFEYSPSPFPSVMRKGPPDEPSSMIDVAAATAGAAQGSEAAPTEVLSDDVLIATGPPSPAPPSERNLDDASPGLVPPFAVCAVCVALPVAVGALPTLGFCLRRFPLQARLLKALHRLP